MAYIYRSNQENFSIETPLVGFPGNILNLNISGGFPKYNGPYFFIPSGTDMYHQLTGQYGTFGIGGLELEQLGIWRNANNLNMVMIQIKYSLLDLEYPDYFSLFDLDYYYVRNSSPELGILFQPYLPVESGVGSDPSEWLWDKEILLYPAGPGTPLAGLNAVPGSPPKTKYYVIDPPFRAAVKTDGQDFIVQGDQFISNLSGGLPI